MYADWWLRDVAGAANFCNVNSNGNSNYNNASNSNGVRPDFLRSYQVAYMVNGLIPKGVGALAERPNGRGGCQSVRCLAINRHTERN
ncbi:DUF6273 domain-containing protein [Porcincola intestinalis]|uniref:DUF6273 domain-containing protein n=1 Tax=Porcincola intestinalis TaxID=2606632 RepID=UPI0038CDA355